MASKVTALTALTAPTTDDTVYIVDNPGGGPLSRKLTIANLFNSTGYTGALTILATPTTLNLGGAATTIALGAATGTTTINNAVTSPVTVAAKPSGTAGIRLDPNAATGDFTLSLSPANLTVSRRATFPDATGTVALLADIAPIIGLCTTAAGQSIPNAATTIVDFGTELVDTHSAITTGAAWKFTAPVSDYYFISATVIFAATTTWADGEIGEMELYIDGAFVLNLVRKDNYGSASSILLGLTGGAVYYLAAGSYADVRVYQSSGAALALLANAAYNHISIMRVGAG